MVTGVFLFIEISYMLLLSCPIKYFFKLVIRNTLSETSKIEDILQPNHSHFPFFPKWLQILT